jgi:molybdopterin-guanine dinucleotide biosynthesis protein A
MSADLPFKKQAFMASLAILAGGSSERMGQDKALKLFLGRPLIQRVLERLTGLADEIIVSTNQPEKYAFLGLALYPDLIPNRGALGGLHSSLAAVHAPWMAAVACDMPFASLPLFEYERDLLLEEKLDAVIPRGTHGAEPLHAIYRRETCLPAIRSALEAGEWKLISWLSKVKVRYVSPAEIAAVDPLGQAFWNLNTPQEFFQAEERARLEERDGG